jgi:hypothetical protein
MPAVLVLLGCTQFDMFSGVNDKYKAKFRSLSFNLKDPKNPDLRNRVSRRMSTVEGAGKQFTCDVCNKPPQHSGLRQQLDITYTSVPCFQVLTGQIPGDVLVNLSAEELASNEMRAKNEQVGAQTGIAAVCMPCSPLSSCYLLHHVSCLLLASLQIREHLKNEAVRGQSNQASTDMFQ